MMTRISLMLTFCFLFGTTQAQLYKAGQLITYNGDTLVGLVAVQTDNTFAYKPHKKGARSLYHIKDLVGYQIGEENFRQYVVEVLRGNFPEKVKAYLKVLQDGPLVLMEYRGQGIYGSGHVNYFLYNGQDNPYRVNRNPGNFRSTMKRYFAECDPVAQKVKEKTYKYADLPQIVEEYNAWFIQRELDSPSEPEEEPENDEENDN